MVDGKSISSLRGSPHLHQTRDAGTGTPILASSTQHGFEIGCGVAGPLRADDG